MAKDTGPGTSIDGAVALVTGGFRGFGAAVAAELLDRGASKIYATSRTAQPSGDFRVVPLVLDVVADDSVAAAALARAGHLDPSEQRRDLAQRAGPDGTVRRSAIRTGHERVRDPPHGQSVRPGTR